MIFTVKFENAQAKVVADKLSSISCLIGGHEGHIGVDAFAGVTASEIQDAVYEVNGGMFCEVEESDMDELDHIL